MCNLVSSIIHKKKKNKENDVQSCVIYLWSHGKLASNLKEWDGNIHSTICNIESKWEFAA